MPLAVALALLALALITLPAPRAAATPAPTPRAIPAAEFAPVALPLPSIEDVIPVPASTPVASAADVTITGTVSWADEALGAHYFAISPYTGWPEGTRVEMCGPGGCAVLTSNDTGPIRRLRRLGDVAVGVWEQVCGVGRAMGLCVVTFTRMPR